MNTEDCAFKKEGDNKAEEKQTARPDMPDDVLDGRLGQLCATRLRHFPRAYSFGAVVTTIGALVPRIDNPPIRPNLFWCAVGDKGSGKSQSLDTTFRLVEMQPPTLLEAKFGSAEGMAEQLKDTGSDSVRLLSVDELGHMLAKCAIQSSSFPYVLNSAFYKDEQIGGSKKQQFSVNCRISLVGGLVEELFGDAFGLATTGGLYDRFLFGLCPSPYQYLYRPFEGPTVKLSPAVPRIASNVWDERDQWVKEGIPARIAELALRVAYICAATDRREVVQASDLKPAMAFAQYQVRVRSVLAPNVGENPDAKCAIKIRSWLLENARGGAWVRRHDLDRGINSYRLGPGVFNRCLNNLWFNGEIELDGKAKAVRLITQ
ncbi:MAG TPA: hypothetical protein VN577_09015 [Terriglobales bacterium]|nr:hypothetical protein [Terriglobales bacterium]